MEQLCPFGDDPPGTAAGTGPVCWGPGSVHGRSVGTVSGRAPACDVPSAMPLSASEEVEEWKVVCGKFLAINATNMSCACPRSPQGLSPAAHLGDGSSDLILIRKCSRFNFLRFLVRHTNQYDQVSGALALPRPRWRAGSIWAASTRAASVQAASLRVIPDCRAVGTRCRVPGNKVRFLVCVSPSGSS